MDICKRFKWALNASKVSVDDPVFQLHYRFTVFILLCGAGLVAAKQHFGESIQCMTSDNVPSKMLDTYCWIHATFTLPDACNKTVGVDVAHPCVDKFSIGRGGGGGGGAYGSKTRERVYHKYYRWVYHVLTIQAAFFYAPHYFWKSCELVKVISRLTADLRDPTGLEAKTEHKARCVVRYFERRRKKNQNNYYCFVMLEHANLINILLQIYAVNVFLGGTFSSYGLEVIQYVWFARDDSNDPMVRIFPRITKCTFHRVGASGDIQKHDALCLLPLNIFNEKIYIVMWFWFVLLALITSISLIHRANTFFKPTLRYEIVKKRAHFVPQEHLRQVLEDCPTGDWFLLCVLGNNMDVSWFSYIISSLARRHDQRRLHGGPSANPAADCRISTDDMSVFSHDQEDGASGTELQAVEGLVGANESA